MALENRSALRRDATPITGGRDPWVTVAAVAVAAVAAVALAGCATGGGQHASPALASTASPVSPSVATALVPNAQGYVRLQTAAHDVRCSLNTELVACQSSNANWPRHPDGTPYAAVSDTAAGVSTAVDADLGELAGLVAMQDGTYTAQGWTIVAHQAGVEFTNLRSGHGMTIGDAGVRSF